MGRGRGKACTTCTSVVCLARPSRGIAQLTLRKTPEKCRKKVPKRLDKIQYVWYTKDTKKEKERSR